MSRIDWWITKNKKSTLLLGLRWGYCRHLSELFGSCIEKNQEENKGNGKKKKYPDSWTQLALDLEMSSKKNIDRKREGKDPFHIHELLVCCTIFDVKPESTLPETVEWLTSAVQYVLHVEELCRTKEEIALFVDYSLHLYRKMRPSQRNWNNYSFYVDRDDVEEIAAKHGIEVDTACTTIREIKGKFGKS